MNTSRYLEEKEPSGGDTFPISTLFHIGIQLPVYSTLLSFLCVIAFVVVLKTLLTMLEGKTVNHPKYFTLVNQMYRELLVGSLINFLSKRLAEFRVFDSDSDLYTAWEAADDMILFFAISLTLQSVIMFIRLRGRNLQLDELSLLTPKELYSQGTSNGTKSKIEKKYVSAAKMFVLRDFFLREYQLPRLFSFPKYLRAVQDTEIIQLYEVEKSTWILLLLIQGFYYFVSDYTEPQYHSKLDDPMTRETIHKNRLIVLFILIFTLTVMMLGLYLYLKKCVSIMVIHAGGDEAQLATALKNIADHAESAPEETTESTLLKLIEKTEHLPEYENESSFGSLLGTIFRKVTKSSWGKKNRDVVHLSCNLHLPMFSRKFVHVLTKFFLTLNGFYFGFLFQAFVVLAGRAHAWSLLIIAGEMAFLLFNMTFLSPRIIRQFALINGIVRVNPGELRSVVEHFIDVLELQRKMVRSITAHCEANNIDLQNLMRELQRIDSEKTRYVEGEILRETIKKYGFKFSKHKFNTFVRLQFKTRGSLVRYDLFYRVLFKEAAAMSLEEEGSVYRRHVTRTGTGGKLGSGMNLTQPRNPLPSSGSSRRESAHSDETGTYPRFV